MGLIVLLGCEVGQERKREGPMTSKTVTRTISVRPFTGRLASRGQSRQTGRAGLSSTLAIFGG
jgi:hypothetical protein